MSIIYINPYQFAAAAASDPDAQSYIAAVEAADGQALEVGVKDAINAFVVGCKSDGIWDAIKASCILAGARTLAGALVPLVGTAPTNFNFVAGDYDRETGLKGNGSTKYLDSDRADTADPRNNNHLSTWIQSAESVNTSAYIGNGEGGAIGGTHFGSGLTSLFTRNRTTTLDTYYGGGATGFMGQSRSTSGSYVFRYNTNSVNVATASSLDLGTNIYIFRRNSTTNSVPTNARLAFYSIGESLDLALLDARVTALVNAIGAAIP